MEHARARVLPFGSFSRKRRRPETDDPRFAVDFRDVEIDEVKTFCPASRREGKEVLYLHSIAGHVSASTSLSYTSTAVKILPVELSFSIAALFHNL